MTAISLLSPSRMSIDNEYIEDHVAGYSSLQVAGRASLEYAITESDRSSDEDGMDYYCKRQQGRTITITFALFASCQAELTARFRALKNFVKGDNRELRFADELGKHYIGTLKTIEPPKEGNLRSDDLIMTFYCSDPYLIADVVTSVTASETSGILTASVNNDGSGKVYPVYKITNNMDNGYLGIVHAGGALEIGNTEEADGSDYTQSEELATLSNLLSAADDTGTNRIHTSYSMTGSLKSEDHNGSCLVLDTIGSGSSSVWRGGMRTFVMPADSENAYGATNFYSYLNIWYETGAMGQTAEISVAYLDASNNVICGYDIRKSDKSGNTAKIEMIVNNKVVKTISFTPSYKDSENPLNEDRGHQDIRKEAGVITFYWFGHYYSFTVSEVAEAACTKVQVAFAQAPGRTRSEKYVTRCYLRKFYLKKMNVEKWKDEPNRYPSGSVIEIDTASDSIKVDGLEKNDELVTGSTFAALPSGTTDVEFYPSSWCTTAPKIVVEYLKRWL